MIKRIGMLTSGGDCQALNATMRGVVKALSNTVDDLEVYGFDDGYKGLIYGKYRMLTAKDFSGILTRGGRENASFCQMPGAAAGRSAAPERLFRRSTADGGAV